MVPSSRTVENRDMLTIHDPVKDKARRDLMRERTRGSHG